MAILTFSRQLGSRGNAIAQKMADRFGYNLMTKEIFDDLLKKNGFPEKGGVGIFSSGQTPSFFESFLVNRNWLIFHVKKAIYEFAQKQDVAILGMGGHAIFRGLPNVLRMRIFAPMDVRVGRVIERFSCEETAARHLIAESDQVRSNFDRYFFDTEWDNIDNYDLTVNTANKSVENVVRLVKEEIQSFNGEQQKDLVERLSELTLEQKILINIFQEHKIAAPGLSVTVRNDGATLKGLTKTIRDRETCALAASQIDGIMNLANEISVEPMLMVA